MTPVMRRRPEPFGKPERPGGGVRGAGFEPAYAYATGSLQGPAAPARRLSPAPFPGLAIPARSAGGYGGRRRRFSRGGPRAPALHRDALREVLEENDVVDGRDPPVRDVDRLRILD